MQPPDKRGEPPDKALQPPDKRGEPLDKTFQPLDKRIEPLDNVQQPLNLDGSRRIRLSFFLFRPNRFNNWEYER